MNKQTACFENLIEQIVNQSFAQIDNFFSDQILNQLFIQLLALQNANLLKKAGIGQANEHGLNKRIRGDEIMWLPKNSLNEFEMEFNSQIQAFMIYLNESCFLSLNDFEFHYTCYPPGTFYKKHIDQFHTDPSRQISFILYLNKAWKEKDGGEVVVYPKHDKAVKISPTWGKVVCFRSHELPHEVILTNTNRYSITGWLKSVNADKILQLID